MKFTSSMARLLEQELHGAQLLRVTPSEYLGSPGKVVFRLQDGRKAYLIVTEYNAEMPLTPKKEAPDNG